MQKFLDYDGLSRVWGKIKTLLSGKVDKVTGKQLSTEDYTTAEKDKLSRIGVNMLIRTGTRQYVDENGIYLTTEDGVLLTGGAATGVTMGDIESNSADGNYSLAVGKNVAVSAEAGVAIGKYNIDSQNYALSVGNGTASTNSNALTLDWSGNLVIQGTVTAATPTANTHLTTKLYVDEKFIEANGSYTDSNGSFHGNVVGNVIGNVTGNLTGDVTGDLTGNADSATKATNDYNDDPIHSTYRKLTNTTYDTITVTTLTNTGTASFSGTITVPTPTANTHPATKAYVDAMLPTIGANDNNKVLAIVNGTYTLVDLRTLLGLGANDVLLTIEDDSE